MQLTSLIRGLCFFLCLLMLVEGEKCVQHAIDEIVEGEMWLERITFFLCVFGDKL